MVRLAVYPTKQHPKKYVTLAFIFFSILMSVYSTNVSGASVSKTFDMVVYGATPAGIMSAVAGIKQHLSVAIFEPSQHIGGMVTGGLSATDSGLGIVITGLTLDFFNRTNALEVAAGANPKTTYVVEPHIATQVFQQLLNENGIQVYTGQSLQSVSKTKSIIEKITFASGLAVLAKVFVDASYEGDLMAKAGISYTWGRESAAQYGEPEAGVMTPICRVPKVDPYIAKGNPASGLFPFVSAAPPARVGSADKNLMAYNYRLCATDFATHGSNAVPYSSLMPAGYSASKYAPVARMIESMTATPGYDPIDVAGSFFFPARNKTTGLLLPYANGKFDINGGAAYSTDVIGIINKYPDGTEAQRQAIRDYIAKYDAGLVYFLATDSQVPKDVRSYINEFGACRDEFADNNYFPTQLYVREGRRMVGAYVMTESDVLLQTTIPDVIAMGGYNMDSHYRQFFAIGGALYVEGESNRAPYDRTGIKPGTAFPISYRSMTPAISEAENLLNPVTSSSSSMAYRALRTEPQMMMMGAAAGAAAALAIQNKVAVQKVTYAQLNKLLAAQKQMMVLPGQCLFNSTVVKNGGSVTAYLHATITPPLSCRKETRVCMNGVLSGTYKYSACVAQ